MNRVTFPRFLASTATIALGIGCYVAYAVSAPPATGLYLGIGIFLWLALGASVGCGIYNLFGRPLRGAVMGLVIQAIGSFLIALAG